MQITCFILVSIKNPSSDKIKNGSDPNNKSGYNSTEKKILENKNQW